MISASRSNAAQFGQAFVQRFGPPAYETLDKLLAISGRLHRLDELACNQGLTPMQVKRGARLELQAQEIIEEIKPGSVAYHQSDPRGWSLYLLSPDDVQAGKFNTAAGCQAPDDNGWDVSVYYHKGLGVPVR